MSDTSIPGTLGAEHEATEGRGTPYAGNVAWLCPQSGEKENTSVTKKDEMENLLYIKEKRGTKFFSKGKKYGLTIAT